MTTGVYPEGFTFFFTIRFLSDTYISILKPVFLIYPCTLSAWTSFNNHVQREQCILCEHYKVCMRTKLFQLCIRTKSSRSNHIKAFKINTFHKVSTIKIISRMSICTDDLILFNLINFEIQYIFLLLLRMKLKVNQ